MFATLVTPILCALSCVMGRFLRWQLRIPFTLRILPIFRKLNAFEDGTRGCLGVEEAKIACTFLPLPYTLHHWLESPSTHFALTFLHGHILAIESYMLHTSFSTSLGHISPWLT